MQTIGNDRAYLESALSDLPDFLLSGDIYWPIGKPHDSSLPQISLGNIRLAAARLMACPDTEKDDPLLGRIDAIYTKWRSTWARKAALEYSSRLHLWRDRLNELIQDPSEPFCRYEMRIRVILELLRADLLSEPPRQMQDLLDELDGLLRASSVAGPFLWDARLEQGFPQDRFWFLYRTIQAQA